MFFMMLNEFSPFAVMFTLDLYFLFMVLKGRRMKIDD
jgi:hypothetical protein